MNETPKARADAKPGNPPKYPPDFDPAHHDARDPDTWLALYLDQSIPLDEQVRGACEILGFDPLYVANEGKFLAIVARDAAERALEAIRSHPLGERAAIIGEVVDGEPGVDVVG